MGLFDNWMGQGGAGSSDPKTPNSQRTAVPESENDPENNPGNNGGTNSDLIDTIWEEQKSEGGSTEPGNSGNTDPGTKPGTEKTEDQVRAEISSYLKSVGLGDLALTAADLEKLQGENSHQEMVNLVNGRIQQAYLQAVQSSQRLFRQELDKRLPAMVEEAVNKSKSFFEGDRLRSVLRQELPFTSDPSIGPIAETVMRQFLVKGVPKDKAVKLTNEYFVRIRKAMDPDYVPPNSNTRTTFRGNPRASIDFLDVLKGK